MSKRQLTGLTHCGNRLSRTGVPGRIVLLFRSAFATAARVHISGTCVRFSFLPGSRMIQGRGSDLESRGMAALQIPARRKFFVEIIKPSHYDDDGYVIQWWRAFIPSNSLA